MANKIKHKEDFGEEEERTAFVDGPMLSMPAGVSTLKTSLTYTLS